MPKPAKPSKSDKAVKSAKAAKPGKAATATAQKSAHKSAPKKVAAKPAAKVAAKPVKSAGKPAKAAPKSGMKEAAKAAVSAVVKAVTKAVKNGEKSAKKTEAPAKAAAVPAPKKSVDKRPAKIQASALRPSPKVVKEVDEEAEGALDAAELEFAEDMDEIVAEAEMAAVDVEDDQEPVQAPVAEKRGTDVVEKTEKKRKRDEIKIDKSGDIEAQWQTLFDKSKGIKPLPYKMSDSYEARTPLQHKVLGWGYVLSSQNNRLEVLFKDGVKILVCNYKSS